MVIRLGATAIGAAFLLAGTAMAAPISGTFSVSIYHGTNPGSSSGDPDEQATTSNPLIAPGSLLQTTSYTGAIDFADAGGGTDTIGAFLGSAGGSFSPVLTSTTAGTTLSTGGFKVTTVLVITGTLSSGISGTITHDDGIGLYQGGSLVTAASATAPTTAEPTAYSLGSGVFELVYVEANGLPADLDFEVVPEAATFSLFGLGLLGLGTARRRVI